MLYVEPAEGARAAAPEGMKHKYELLCHGLAGQAHTPYHFEVMAGVSNALAEKHVPYVTPRSDWFAGPEGRKADRVNHLFLTTVIPPPPALCCLLPLVCLA